MSGKSEIMHCGILFNIPYWSNVITLIGGIWDLLLRWMQLHLILISKRYTWIHSAYFMPKTSNSNQCQNIKTKIRNKFYFPTCWVIFSFPSKMKTCRFMVCIVTQRDVETGQWLWAFSFHSERWNRKNPKTSAPNQC